MRLLELFAACLFKNMFWKKMSHESPRLRFLSMVVVFFASKKPQKRTPKLKTTSLQVLLFFPQLCFQL